MLYYVLNMQEITMESTQGAPLGPSQYAPTSEQGRLLCFYPANERSNKTKQRSRPCSEVGSEVGA